MKYILNENIALRSWRLIPYAYYIKNDFAAKGLKKEMFDLLLQCDGESEIPESEPLKEALKKRFIREAKQGEHLSDWQKYRSCDNRYMPKMNLQITAKCNYNCIHCFNAVDNAPLLSEMRFEQVLTLLDEAQECGVSAFTITGGEPMAHKRFSDIVREIYRRDMFIDELNTNGYYISQQTLDEFREIGCFPLIKISFDGVGYHDWMRGRAGAEKDALRAIRLCVDNGFRVMIQYNINRKNEPTILESLDLLDKMGVSRIRLICTTPAPRWEQNAAGQSYTTEEYFDASMKILEHYIRSPHRAELIIWQLGNVYPDRRAYSLAPVKNTTERYRDTLPLCKGTRGMIAVGANGQTYPCLQMSGWMDEHQWDLGNVFRDGLKSILQDSKFLDCVCQTVKERAVQNGKCGSCQYFRYCFGGCPALGLLYSPRRSILDADPTKCLFFEKGYYEKITALFDGWKNLSVM